MNFRRWLLAGLCALGVVSCASCIPCDHPLCDQKTAVADDALIGDCLLNYGEDKTSFNLAIGRKGDSKNVLEWLTCGVEDQRVEVLRHDIRMPAASDRWSYHYFRLCYAGNDLIPPTLMLSDIVDSDAINTVLGVEWLAILFEVRLAVF